MPVCRHLNSFTALAALAVAVLASLSACSADTSLDSGGAVPASEIDQTVASDVGESFAANVSLFQENESFQENLSGGSSTFMAGRSGADLGAESRTVTCDGPDADGWFGCIAYTSRGLTITRQIRFWNGGSLALGWSPTLTDSVNHRWSRTGTFASVLKPGKMFSINEADSASMVVTRAVPVLHTWIGAGVAHDSSTYQVNGVTRIFAYALFRQRFSGPRWEALAARGARVQRPLWASTSTKNPAYRDVMYVEDLIGPDTVNTMPPATIAAFADHGVVKRTVDEHVEEERALIDKLEEFGVSLTGITDTLLRDGLASFEKSFGTLIAGLEAKRRKLGAAVTTR